MPDDTDVEPPTSRQAAGRVLPELKTGFSQAYHSCLMTGVGKPRKLFASTVIEEPSNEVPESVGSDVNSAG